MKGSYHIIVQNNRLRYEMDIRRNITILRGDSATGKTTLIQMLTQAMNLGENSGIEVRCEKEVRVLGGRDWKVILKSLRQQIIFLDEENTFIKSQEFAEEVRRSDCYFVLVTREDLPNLPYAVDEIYGIHTSGRYHDTRRVYQELYRIYSAEEFEAPVIPDRIVVEDSGAGYDFFSNVCREKQVRCESAGGKSGLKKKADNCGDGITVMIADGAAIGPEMNELFQLMQRYPNVKCYLPESFEWLILKSGLINGSEIAEILKRPEDFIESSLFFSWEQFFTRLLIESTSGTFQQYQKAKLNSYYLQDKIKKSILEIIEGVKFSE
ncbi:MAG: translation initiation factor 2 [Eubacterium sp.]|nr:translation initiation factor 2 [Eubacterium sp.]